LSSSNFDLDVKQGGWKFRVANELSLSMLIDREVWFSAPEGLNDPFDSSINLKEIYKDVAKKLKNEEGVGRGGIDSPDVYVGAWGQDNEVLPLIYSLCGAINNHLMWSHYSDEHRGLAFGFDFSQDDLFSDKSIEVSYDRVVDEICEDAIRKHHIYRDANASSKKLDPDKLGMLSEDYNKVASLFQTVRFSLKENDWAYENERRFFKLSRDFSLKGEAQRFSEKSLKFVVFGAKCNDRFKKTILNLLREESYEHVEVYESIVDVKSRSLLYKKKLWR
jgi:hypothetical protein